MSSLTVLIAVYFIGGVTLVPILVACVFVHGFFTLPQNGKFSTDSAKIDLSPDDEAGESNAELKARLEDGNHETDVAACYFAVCREYVPGGINGKPPERTTPAGQVIAAESPSVYQSMYRSIFERNKTQSPSIESGKPIKRARNVFYVVLRHGHLLLFDDSDQIEVRHVIALARYDVDIYGGGGSLQEGDLYIKRNCMGAICSTVLSKFQGLIEYVAIRLSKKRTPESSSASLAPFFFFSDNSSDKEDFYHALLSSQRKSGHGSPDLPLEQSFETEDMIKLIRLLHVSEDNIQNRWLNALVGRLFLALYKTPEIENFIRTKIKKKIARVRKPAFITSLKLEDVGMGESAPTFSNVKLKDMQVDGAVSLEADVKYNGKFKAVISAVAKIELGHRFKPREVDLVLAGVLNRLDGHILVKIKPPPSNRIWVSFETMPKLEIAIEPIVSSRQITYGVIIRAIESRIREVFGETLVFPNWDDIPFTSTESQQYRGGIWEVDPFSKSATTDNATATEDGVRKEADDSCAGSVPAEGPAEEHGENEPQFQLSQTEPPSMPSTPRGSPDTSSRPDSPVQPPHMPMRSNSFAAPALASPAVVTKIPIASDRVNKLNTGKRADATSAMKSLSIRSQDSSPLSSPTQSTGKDSMNSVPTSVSGFGDGSYITGTDIEGKKPESIQSHVAQSEDVASLGGELRSRLAKRDSSVVLPEGKAAAMNQTFTSATAAAKRWGLSVMQRGKDSEEFNPSPQPARAGSISEPVGRGQPLPPPGEPLPPPESKGWASGAFGSLKRKPVPGSSVTSLPTLQDLFPVRKNSDGEKATIANIVSSGQTTAAEPLDLETKSIQNEQSTHKESESPTFLHESASKHEQGIPTEPQTTSS